MKNNILSFPQPQISHHRLGKVISAKNGLAESILSEGQRFTVYQQAAHIGALQRHDEILFVISAKGPYILARSPRYHETPGNTLQFGNALIDLAANGNITLSTGEATLQLSPDGKILLKGTRIMQRSDEDITLNAQRHLYLNTQS